MKESTRDKLAILVQILFTIPISFILIDNSADNTLNLTNRMATLSSGIIAIICFYIQYLIWRKK